MDTPLSIVVVEDHDDLRNATVEALQDKGHHVSGVDCAEALAELADQNTDLLILDLNLPGEDGLSIAKRIRTTQTGIGIIMLTARSELSDKMAGYDSGADIYLTKPVSLDELNAAIGALARRLKPAKPPGSTLQLTTSRLLLQGPLGEVKLTPTETAALTAFTRASGGRLETWQLIELFGKNLDNYSKSALEVHIVRLRKKLKQVTPETQLIKAIREFGYQLCVPLQLI